MMYTALYRKWRPLTFNDVISQPHITNTLKNQIKNSKTAHAYLFTGSRGTGKTTCARILAKAVNCLNPQNGNPCLECEICRNADLSALTDIIEIDAASNNGVDDIRELRDGILYTPEQCSFRIYIIDEVHMLSQSAFNALLKIMEEPPPYVKFILATTEIHKVPATILSRCQRFDFRRIKSEDISARLSFIASEENITLEKSAADFIARLSDGGMRDAISLLDQCSAFADNVTSETVAAASGTAGRKYIFDILNAVVSNNAPDALNIINNLHSLSKDMQRLCDEIAVQLRNIMLLKSGVSDMSILSCMPDEIDILHSISEKTDMNTVLFQLSEVQNCISRMSRCINKRTETEMCIIKLCTPPNTAVPVRQQPVISTPPQPPKQVPLKTEDITPLKNWADIMSALSEINPAVVGALAESKAFVNQKAGVVLIKAANPFFITIFKNNPDNRISLENIIEKFLGKHFTILANCTAKPDENQQNALKLIRKASADGIPVETE
jgi:DNA polymerase-3 subunit gamma/tau